MARKMALAAVGRDCPGIVSAVSRVLYHHGCNLEDTSMTILRGEFAMILIVAVPQEAELEGLRGDLEREAERLQLVLSFRELPHHTERAAPESGALPYIISVYGADHPGIVYRVTELLADNSINITDVNTRVVGKEPVYIMLLEVEVPARLSPQSLEGMLEKLGQELKVEITCRPLETAHL
ncbi:MAG: ACT domain-containing protein [Candidatus Eremiobacterota bacterium]